MELWKPADWLSRTREEEDEHLVKWPWWSWNNLVPKPYTVQPNPVFKRSYEYLAEWCARRVGRLLAYKVAGHRLPAELVECIEDWYVVHTTEAFDTEEPREIEKDVGRDD